MIVSCWCGGCQNERLRHQTRSLTEKVESSTRRIEALQNLLEAAAARQAAMLQQASQAAALQAAATTSAAVPAPVERGRGGGRGEAVDQVREGGTKALSTCGNEIEVC